MNKHLSKAARAAVIAGAMAGAVLTSGCASSVPLLKQTKSGYAEGLFNGKTVDSVKDSLTEACVSRGYIIHDSSANQITCAETLKDGEGIFVQVMLGNAYSTTPVKKTRFTVFKVAQGTKAVGNSWVETQMAFGQLNKAELNSAKQVNALQSLFFELGAE